MRQWGDAALLSAYANRQSEAAFGVLVERYVALVHSAALRQLQNPHLAQEATQAVFLILAQKARRLSGRTVLSGWLCRTAHFVARNALKAELRRQYREQEAHMQSLLNEPDADAWTQFAPLLDEAVAQLGEADRNAVVLRFYEQKPLNEVGSVLGVDPDAAQKRVTRAVEKLRKFFTRRGVALSAAAITGALTANSVQAAPAGLAATVTAVTAKGAVASTTTLTLIKGALKLMAWSKAKIVIVAGICLVITAATPTVAVRKFSAPATEDIFKNYSDDSYLMKARPVVLLRPSRYVNRGDWINGVGERFLGRGRAFAWVLSAAYGFGPDRMVLPTNSPWGQFDYLVTLPAGSKEALQAEIKRQFGLVAHPETREVDVMVLKTDGPGTALTPGKGGTDNRILANPGQLKLTNFKMSGLADALAGYYFHVPVLDETGLSGSYDLTVEWNGSVKGDAARAEIARALHEQIGLSLVPEHRPVEMLVVEYADAHEVQPPLPRASWEYKGYATPEDALQSVFWAMNEGDAQGFLAGLTPEYRKRSGARFGGKLADSQHKASDIAGYQVLCEETLSDDEAVLYIRSTHLGNARITMKKVKDGWKADEEPH